MSAYNQLMASERDFVDGFISYLEREAEKRFERLTVTLARASDNIRMDELDARTRALFDKPLVGAAIRERVELLASQRDLTPERVIKEHAALALSNMNDFIERFEDGSASINLSNVSVAQMAAVQQIETEETYGPSGTKRKIKLKLYNKQVSLDALAKFNGLDKGDSPEAIAYRALPANSVEMPANITVEQAAEDYANFIAD